MIIRNTTIHDLSKIVDLQNSNVNAGFVGLLRESSYEIEKRNSWFSQFSAVGQYVFKISNISWLKPAIVIIQFKNLCLVER